MPLDRCPDRQDQVLQKLVLLIPANHFVANLVVFIHTHCTNNVMLKLLLAESVLRGCSDHPPARHRPRQSSPAGR